MSASNTGKCSRCGELSELVKLNPCGHQTLCINCLEKYRRDTDRCHVCDIKIDNIVLLDAISALLSLSEIKPSDKKHETIDCGVCTSTCIPVTLFPCHHSSFCASCIGSLESLYCPLCRQRIMFVKEQGKESLNAESFQSRRNEVELDELDKTMQIVMFGVNGPKRLKINTVHDGERQSKFSPNWMCDGYQMNIIFASISIHGNYNLIPSLKPDIFVIVQNNLSDQSYQESFTIHERLKKVMEKQSPIPIVWLIKDGECFYLVHKYHYSSYTSLSGGLRINMDSENGEKALFQGLYNICNEQWESL